MKQEINIYKRKKAMLSDKLPDELLKVLTKKLVEWFPHFKVKNYIEIDQFIKYGYHEPNTSQSVCLFLLFLMLFYLTYQWFLKIFDSL